jgi:UDP-GlcNAc:undecaprenyl-phosphate GlcNAc-1-phosphate transferase
MSGFGPLRSTNAAAEAATSVVPPGVANRIEDLGQQIETLAARQQELLSVIGLGGEPQQTWLEVLNGYLAVLVVAFLVTVLTVPILQKLAIANGIVDRPDARKMHRMPIAYLGGVGVYLGIMAGILISYLGVAFPGIVGYHVTRFVTPAGNPMLVPPWILGGLTIIMLIGLYDDVMGISPRVKVGGQLLAAAALAYGDVGVKVAEGVLSPTVGALLNHRDLTWVFQLPGEVPFIGSAVEIDLIYWTGTAVIAVFILGACNASNLIDGLDGLLSGVTGIACLGLLAVAIMLVFDDPGPRDSQRIVLCLAVLGACLGFLPHNFNPATIFLGDCGSLLLGFSTIVIVLTLGDNGRTDLVIAGLVIYAIPILDTALAIVRRKLAGKKMSDPDANHLHHMLKRALGVKGAVFSLYGIGAAFALIGVLLAASNARLIYTLALVCASFIVVYSIKLARKKQIEEQIIESDARALSEQASTPAEPVPGPESATVS